MTKITQKLKSRRGASLILAMVFMLLCLFVGGSVLAAATANGGRVADLNNSQQTYLSQRSAALLMADMLEGDNAPFQLTIKTVSTDAATTVTYSLPELPASETYSTLQRILVENAIQKYRFGRGSATGTTENMENFSFGEEPYQNNTAHLYPAADYTGTFQITMADDENSVTETLTATFVSPAPETNVALKSKHFDMTFYFGTDSLISLYVKASFKDGLPITVTQDGTTTTTTTTVIRWDDPVIEKGGFKS